MPTPSQNNNSNKLNEEVIFQLGSLKTEVEYISKKIDASFNTLRDEMRGMTTSQKERLRECEMDILTNNNDIQTLKDQYLAAKTQIRMGLAGITIVWLIFGEAVQTFMDKVFY